MACRPQVCKAMGVWMRVCVCACVYVRVLSKHMGGILKRTPRQTQFKLSQSAPSIHKQKTQEAVKERVEAREREREAALLTGVD